MVKKYYQQVIVTQIIIIGIFLTVNITNQSQEDLTKSFELDQSLNQKKNILSPIQSLLIDQKGVLLDKKLTSLGEDSEKYLGHSFSTYLGGFYNDHISHMVVDKNGDIYLSGETYSSDFPILNAFQVTYEGFGGGFYQGFLSKFSSDGQLLFSTYFGGSGNDHIDEMLINENGDIYLSGSTRSSDFPILNAYQATFGEGRNDGFLSKFSAEGQLLFSTYLGGSDGDSINYMLVDENSDIYLSGITRSSDFPVLNAYQATYGGEVDIFLSKFSGDGQLLFSTYLGGADDEYIAEILINEDNSIFIGGSTRSSDFPILNAYQVTHGGERDIFLSKFSNDGELLFSTYLGGADDDSITHMLIDENSKVYLGGQTYSLYFPVLNAFQRIKMGSNDIFLSKFSTDGELLFSTYLGGANDDSITHMLTDENGDIYLSGQTYSLYFPVFKAYQTAGGDSFLTKFSTNGQLLFSTYIGGSGYSRINEMHKDENGDIYLSGYTYSYDFPIVNAFQAIYGGWGDAYLSKFSTNGQLLFSTYLGGSSPKDYITHMLVDENCTMYLSGETSSPDFPILNAYQTTSGRRADIFLVVFHASDQDLDGMNDLWEQDYGLNPSVNDANDDLEGDGMNNLWEYHMGLDPAHNDTQEDRDQDGLMNILEFELGSNANNQDTDYDGIPDGYEYQMGLNLVIDDAQDDLDSDVMPNLWEYQNGLNAGLNDQLEDLDSDGLPNLWEFLLGSNANNSTDIWLDADNDTMPNLWEYQAGLRPLFNDTQDDLDSDGMPNLWEYQNRLNVSFNDTQEDLDGDGLPNLMEFLLGSNANNPADSWLDTDQDTMPNLWEYQKGLNPLINDAQDDLDSDEMPNLWEYQNGLNVSKNDALDDLDGDWVPNIFEYRIGTNINDFWSFPLITPNFPYVFSAPHLLLFLTIIFCAGFGVFFGILLQKYKQYSLQRLLIKKFNVRDYQTALLMEKGHFTDYDVFKKALKLNISSLEEYEFQLDLDQSLEEL
ncbi:MAG: SBBP repeat-containing protein [Candidatus Hodarchaeales archaeon]|jgi:hypothetical protein